MPKAPSPNSVDNSITRKVKQSVPGSVFTTADFTSFGGTAAVEKSLVRLVNRGLLRRLARGLYDKPRHSDMFGILWPTPEDVIKAICDRDKIRVQPAGVHAANMLGLSEQVPAKHVYLTDGASRMVKAGPMRIALRHTSPRNMETAGRFAGLLIQAFKSLGPKHVDRFHLAHLKKNIPPKELKGLVKDLNAAPAWMRPLFKELSGTPRTKRMKPLADRPEP
jgi:hypothetical protein